MNAFAPATAVYGLCLVTSLGCAALLARAWRQTRSRLLLWTAISFVLFSLNNLLLVADMVWLPQTDLRMWRNLSAGAALAVLLYGFIWEAEP